MWVSAPAPKHPMHASDPGPLPPMHAFAIIRADFCMHMLYCHSHAYPVSELLGCMHRIIRGVSCLYCPNALIPACMYHELLDWMTWLLPNTTICIWDECSYETIVHYTSITVCSDHVLVRALRTQGLQEGNHRYTELHRLQSKYTERSYAIGNGHIP